MKKIISILLALSMALTVLASCNSEPTETPKIPDEPEVIDPAEPNAPDSSENVDPVAPDVPTDDFESVIIPPVTENYTSDTVEKVLRWNIKNSGSSDSKSVPLSFDVVEFPAGSTLEYDICTSDGTAATAFFDFMITDVGFVSTIGLTDDAGFGTDVYTDYSDYSENQWYHRVFKLPVDGGPYISQKSAFRVVRMEPNSDYTYYIDNICIKDSNGNVVKAFSDEDFAIEVADRSGVSCTLEVVDDPYSNISRKNVFEYAYFHEAMGTLTGMDSIDMTVSFNEADSCPGIYVGTKDENSLFGINGYAFCIDNSEILLYRMSDSLKLLTSMSVSGVKLNSDISVRLEYDGNFLRGYYLDDVEGYEPWPEFEVRIKGLSGAEYGAMNLRGGSYMLKNAERTDLSAKTLEKPFTNPVIPTDAADPDILYYDGMYYVYFTAHRYGVYRSPDLVNWEYVGTTVSELTWDVADEEWWAPDVEEYNGKFYMLVSPSHCLGLAVSDSPTGPFVTVGEPFFREFSIDGNLYVDDDGSVYVYFTGEFSSSEHYNAIYGAKIDMENYTLDMSTLTLLLYPEGWERRLHKGTGTVEGAYMLKHENKYYLVYSGNDFAADNYALGYAVSDSPLGPFTKFEGNPVFRTSPDIKGPGHNSFIKLENGDIYNVYHYWPETSGVGGRITGINKTRFSPTESGEFRLELYAPSLAPQEYPNN